MTLKAWITTSLPLMSLGITVANEFTELPTEVAAHILQYLVPRDKVNLQKTCEHFENFCQQPIAWKNVRDEIVYEIKVPKKRDEEGPLQKISKTILIYKDKGQLKEEIFPGGHEEQLEKIKIPIVKTYVFPIEADLKLHGEKQYEDILELITPKITEKDKAITSVREPFGLTLQTFKSELIFEQGKCQKFIFPNNWIVEVPFETKSVRVHANSYFPRNFEISSTFIGEHKHTFYPDGRYEIEAHDKKITLYPEKRMDCPRGWIPPRSSTKLVLTYFETKNPSS